MDKLNHHLLNASELGLVPFELFKKSFLFVLLLLSGSEGAEERQSLRILLNPI